MKNQGVIPVLIFCFSCLSILCPCQEFYKDSGKYVYPDGVDYTHFNDVWAYYIDEDRWEEIHPAGDPPPPIRCHAAVYDPINQRMVISGGGTYHFDNPYSYILFSLSLTKGSETWSWISPYSTGFPGNLWGEEMFYHPGMKSVIAYTRSDLTLHIWNMETNVCDQVQLTTAPLTRTLAAMAFDEERDRILLYGGGDCELNGSNGIIYDELWELKLAPGAQKWTKLPIPGDAPPKKWCARAVIDPSSDRLILYGGNSWPEFFDGDYKDTTYEMNLETLVWEKIDAITPPSARGQFAPVWDKVTSQMFLFGGLYRVGESMWNVITYNELWTYDLATKSWFQQLPQGYTPAIRRMPSAILDELNRRIIIFGGERILPSHIVQAAIKIPRNRQKINGNSVTVMADIVTSDVCAVWDVRFQYRQPSVTGEWVDIIPTEPNHPNPDPDFPFFIHWDVTLLPEGEADIRAIARNLAGVSDPAPDDITVTITRLEYDTLENLSPNGHGILTYRIDNRKLADIGTCDTIGAAGVGNASSANVRLRIPLEVFTTGTLVQATFLDLEDYPVWNLEDGALGYVIDLNANGFQTNFDSGKKVKLIIQYPDQNQDGFIDGAMMREKSLEIYAADVQEKGDYVILEDAVIDPFGNTISCETGFFSLFILKGDPLPHLSSWSLF
ncbi:hypothetical protein JW926_14745 [Candidatus Sumerlaeota bacterium]|nr:hypothetical protein [Candidatus Sumerlaeota bacterium]